MSDFDQGDPEVNRQIKLNESEGRCELYLWPQPDLTSKAKPGKSVTVTFPVSITYNGGTVIDGKWYLGYEVPTPVVPKGYKLVSMGMGLELNAHPPYATMLLRPDTEPTYKDLT